MVTILVEREGMDKRRKIGKANEKRKKGKVKRAKDEEVHGQGKKKGRKSGTLAPRLVTRWQHVMRLAYVSIQV